MNKIEIKQINDLPEILQSIEGSVDNLVTLDTAQTISGAKTFNTTTNMSRPMQFADRKLYSFYANPLASVWETAKLDIAEPNQFRKFNIDYIDVTASLTDDADDWDSTLIKNSYTKPYLTSVDGNAIMNARIRENDLPLVKRVKIEIDCDPTSGQVSGQNSRMWLTNLCILGNTTRATHKMRIDLFRNDVWTTFMNDQTRSKSAEFIDHVCHPQINFGTGANATDYTKIRIIFYDFAFLSNVQSTSDFQLRKIWWFGPYPNKINKPTMVEDLDGNVTYTGNINSSEGKLASESYVNSQGGEKNQNAFSTISIGTDTINALLPSSTLLMSGSGNTTISVMDNVLTINSEQTEANVIDVSNMFDVSTTADTSAFMFKRESGNHLIRMHGFDNSLTDNDLIIVPALGFGPLYSSYQSSVLTLDGTTFNNYAIRIEKEYTGVEGKITVPDGILTFDITYYLHDGSNMPTSYYIDRSNVMHPFTLSNTPIENLCSSSTSLIINGVSVNKPEITEIVFGTDYDSVTSIPNYFIYNLANITNINLSGLSNVSEIGESFLLSCFRITSIDLSGLSKITKIPSGFLRLCSNLTSVDLSFLSNVIEIGDYFLSSCGLLASIDLSPLSKVTTIGSNFLYQCYAIKSIDLSSLNNVVSVGNYFLSHNSIGSIDLTPMSNLESIGYYFISQSAVSSINITGLEKLTSIPNYFIANCNNITSMDLSPLYNVTEIGNDFLSYCKSLRTVDISSLVNVTSIGSSFFSGCSYLTRIDISSLTNVTSIGSHFLSYCSALGGSFDTRYLSKIMTIGHYFLYRTVISYIDLRGFNNVKSIGALFMSFNVSLSNIDISPLVSIEQIGPGFLNSDSHLRKIRIGSLDFTNVAIEDSSTSIVEGTIYASTYELAVIFKEKFKVNLAKWDITLESLYTYNYNDPERVQYFNIEQTPIANLCTQWTTLVIIDTRVEGDLITTLFLSKEYEIVENIPSYFLRGFSSLTKVNLDFASNVTSVDSYFLSGCSSLNEINIGSVDWSNKTVNTTSLMSSVPNLQTCILRASSEEIGNAFKTKMNGAISNWTIVVNP